MDRYTELKNMSLEDLASVVSAWPWFGTAQKLLCEKMVQIGGSEWGTSQYADAAMHIACRGKISSLLRRKYAYDRDEVAGIIARYLSEKRAPGHPSGVNRDFRGVGDYFSLAQYENVRQKDDDSFRRFASGDMEVSPVDVATDFDMDFCTENLAQIYAEQGYYQQAKDIYSKLILAYPEKNAYFAALIEKLGPEN